MEGNPLFPGGGGGPAVLPGHKIDRRDRLGALADDGSLDLVRRPYPERREVIGDEFGRAVEVRVRYPDAAWRQRLERHLDVRQARDRQRAEARAVIGDVPAQLLVPGWLARQPGVLLGEPASGLDRVRTAGPVEDPVQ